MSEAIQTFNMLLDELRTCKLILATKKIRTLLKCVAYYDELRAVVAQCQTNFDYESAYSRALVSLGTHTTFKLPESDKKKVALSICLLAEFDMLKRDFMKFVLDFFPAEGGNESYFLFAAEVLFPFQEAFNAVYEGRESSELETQAGEEEAAAVNEGIAAQAHYTVLGIVDIVKGASLEAHERAECLTMLEGFALAIDMRDPVLLRVVWIGLKNTLRHHRLANKKLKELEEILKLYMVI